MKLYEVPRKTRIRINGVGETRFQHPLELNFHHIDGMYSYCTDDNKKVWHISANTEVEIVCCNQDCNQGRNCPATKETQHGT